MLYIIVIRYKMTESKKKDKLIAFRTDDTQASTLERLSQASGNSISQEIRKSIDETISLREIKQDAAKRNLQAWGQQIQREKDAENIRVQSLLDREAFLHQAEETKCNCGHR